MLALAMLCLQDKHDSRNSIKCEGLPGKMFQDCTGVPRNTPFQERTSKISHELLSMAE